MEQDIKTLVFSKNVIEFVTVSVQYCGYLENLEEDSVEEVADKLTKILALLYLKASVLPETEPVDEGSPEMFVTEAHYSFISSRLCSIFGENDDYLEVFMEDMKYSDTPILASISEDLTDVYQDLKNFLHIYEQGIEENMNDALFLCVENFKSYWGQKLVNVLRALHNLKYSSKEEEDEFLNQEEEW